MESRVTIKWTDTAKKALGRLPPKVRKSLIEKFDELQDGDPRQIHKPLTGPLRCRRDKRYRYV